jgi:GTP-binding protein
MLCNKKKLAKTSGKPGKTQLINHFLINTTWHLVDLPGFGYAQASKKNKKEFQKFIMRYFEQRKQLVNAFVLIDCRHEPQKIDLEFLEYLGVNAIPFSIVFTKADKLKPGALERNVELYLEKLSEIYEPLPKYFITSSTSKLGRKELLTYIEEINSGL